MPRNIVFDLDSTLINSYEEKDARKRYGTLKLFSENHSLRKKIYSFELGSKQKQFVWGVFRPHYNELIEYCFRNFDNVLVWSAGYEEYVDQICTAIFGKRKNKIPVILSREYCTNEKGMVVKKLDHLFEDYSHLGISRTNTIIIDDNSETFKYNKENAFHITAFQFPFLAQDLVEELKNLKDDHLLKLLSYFEENSDFWESDDVREVHPGRIF